MSRFPGLRVPILCSFCQRPCSSGGRPETSPILLHSLGALDLAVAYLKNYAVDKADALYTATEPFCNMAS